MAVVRREPPPKTAALAPLRKLAVSNRDVDEALDDVEDDLALARKSSRKAKCPPPSKTADGLEAVADNVLFAQILESFCSYEQAKRLRCLVDETKVAFPQVFSPQGVPEGHFPQLADSAAKILPHARVCDFSVPEEAQRPEWSEVSADSVPVQPSPNQSGEVCPLGLRVSGFYSLVPKPENAEHAIRPASPLCVEMTRRGDKKTVKSYFLVSDMDRFLGLLRRLDAAQSDSTHPSSAPLWE